MTRLGPDTEELLNRAAQGDRSARDGLMRRHRRRLCRMVGVRMDKRLAARIDPSDVVQEVLAEAQRRLDDYLRERPIPFYPWLRQMAWERLVDEHRRHVKAARRSVTREEMPLPDASAMNLAELLSADAFGPSEIARRKEVAVQVRAALDMLTERDREVLVLRHLEQMPAREVAATLGLSESAVKSRSLRAMQRLRELLVGGQSEGGQ